MNRYPITLWQDAVDPRLRGTWNRVTVSAVSLTSGAMVYLVLSDAQGDALNDGLFLSAPEATSPSAPASNEFLCFIPLAATDFRIYAVGEAAKKVTIGRPSFSPVSRARATLYLLRRARPQALVELLKSGLLRPGRLLRSIRQLLISTNLALHRPPQDYGSWIRLFDTWSAAEFPAAPEHPSIAYLILAREAESRALTATVQSLDAQYDGSRYAVMHPAAGPLVFQKLKELEAEYIGILQAGEILPQHATVMAAEQLYQLKLPEIAIADDDDIDASGQRCSPRFKPQPSHITMLSGSLSRGLWLVRSDVLFGHTPISATGSNANEAEVLRLDLWLERHRAGARDFSRRIPFVLTHRRSDTETASPVTLANVVQRHLVRGAPSISPIEAWPLTFTLRNATSSRARITVIVPSTLRQPHSLACVKAILRKTDYSQLDLHVVVMQPDPLDAVQCAAAEALRHCHNATVTHFASPQFNFSAANNYVAARTEGDHILLLNDDVSPIRGNWLCWMAAFLEDPNVGIVGARLLYADNRVQHGGVIMGLAGLCEHANRYLPGSEPGYMSRAILAQEMSVVTGACMLVRRSVFEKVGGLDVGYPSAFNDVDFALRVGEAGYSVIYAPQAELYHHELQTYGSHYAGERQPFRDIEADRMRRRWAGVCADDPFHNPNLSLLPSQEWALSFPPRAPKPPCCPAYPDR